MIGGRHASASCARARSIYVVAKLGGIAGRPPPKEDETVWIGGSGKTATGIRRARQGQVR